VREVSGEYRRGEVVAICDLQGRELARGLANYASSETRRIAGHGSGDIEALLGYVAEPELVHRDNLVLS
jgi:glutamate 5-kinase